MVGYVVEVKGPVVDCLFEDSLLPKINDALIINVPKEENNGVRKSFNDLQQRIEKALFSIEFYKNVSVNWDNMSNKEKDEYVLAILNDFSKVLGDKE